MAYHRSGPRTTSVNGYKVLETPDGKFKVLTDEGQIGLDFSTFEEAAEYAKSIPSRAPGQR